MAQQHSWALLRWNGRKGLNGVLGVNEMTLVIKIRAMPFKAAPSAAATRRARELALEELTQGHQRGVPSLVYLFITLIICAVLISTGIEVAGDFE